MANEDSALKEVDQELAEERQWAMFRKYGPAAIALGLAIVLGVAGRQYWESRQVTVSHEQALEFASAVELLESDAEAGRDALLAISEENASGYSVLAAFYRANSFAQNGERLAAIAAFRAIYKDGGTPKKLRQLARLRAAYLSLSDGRDEVLADLGELAQSDGAYSYLAREAAAIAALQAKDYETAVAMFRALAIDPGASEPLRERAEELAALGEAAKAGVNITGELKMDDLLQTLGPQTAPGDETGDAANGNDHAGHDHEVEINAPQAGGAEQQPQNQSEIE